MRNFIKVSALILGLFSGICIYAEASDKESAQNSSSEKDVKSCCAANQCCAYYEVLPTKTLNDIPYRIPAIACTNKGDLIVTADYRHSRRDIGVDGDSGRIDLHGRISKDNGKTWSEIFTIVEGKAPNSPDAFHTGFGDPAIVADRESEEVFLLSCAGNVSYQRGKRDKHQDIAIFHSKDGGKTWSAPQNITESFYKQFDNSTRGPIQSMFIGSGKIHQSRYTKVGKYYRLYCAALVKDLNGTYCNYIFYSDDFGYTWTLLGDANIPAIPSGGDEPKAEELPNGNIIVSSRIHGGRAYNIFTFSDAKTAKGEWGTYAKSDATNNGVIAVNNSTNGEILIIPVIRKADNTPMWLALQSVPFGGGRRNVGIYYKELSSNADYDTPSDFAKDWDGRFQVSNKRSAYSTMVKQANNTIGFLYEEDTYNALSGGGFNIVFVSYSIETITDGIYEYDTTRK